MGERTTGRNAYWFPLMLLGFGLLALLGWEGVRPVEDFGWFAYAPEPSYPYDNSATPLLVTSGPDWTWPLLITVCLVGSITWYGRRAGGSVRRLAAVAVGAGATVWLVHLLAAIADATAGLGEPVSSVGLPLLGLGLLAGAYFLFGPRRRAAAVVGAVCLGGGVAVVLGAWAPGLIDPVLIACGLLALAWYERSRLVAVVSFVVLAALVLVPDGTLRTLVPAVVLLAAAIAALARRGGAAPAA